MINQKKKRKRKQNHFIFNFIKTINLINYLMELSRYIEQYTLFFFIEPQNQVTFYYSI